MPRRRRPHHDGPLGALSVDDLALESKVALTSGGGGWSTKSLDLVPAVVLTDGPHGVRLQRDNGHGNDLANSHPATCFPPAAALGCSFDLDMLERVGEALGREARALGVGVLLGPGINIKRSPLGGRNFEYLSEDPFVAGQLGGALVRGIQSQRVAACVKHLAANNQETDRLRVSADVDERPLREIYLRAFETIVRRDAPLTIMCSYNKINGVLASENHWLLTQVLRDTWGFRGVVISDWGAVECRVASLVAGLDLEMPSTGGRSDADVLRALREGSIDAAVVDRSAGRILDLVRTVTDPGDAPAFSVDEHHALAQEAAEVSLVLLKNNGVLPLDLAQPAHRVAVVGELARTPRYQGAGSSLVNPTRTVAALDAIAPFVDEAVQFAPGYRLDGRPDDDLVADAVEVTKRAHVVVVFVGLPPDQESEGFDRSDIELPAEQVRLLDAVLQAHSRVVVVLSHGGVLRVSGFADRAAAIIDGWLLGQAGGGAIARTLFGLSNPSGRLAETIPIRVEDGASYVNFPGENGHVRYGEGLFVGYRWYDACKRAVSFPFGHGLSYTSFEYGDMETFAVDGGVAVEVTVRNTGSRAGAEVVQVYARVPESSVTRPPAELKGFTKVHLQAGEAKRVRVSIERRDLAYWDTRVSDWVVEGATYLLDVGSSSRDIRLSASIIVQGDPCHVPVNLESSIAEVLASPAARKRVLALFARNGDEEALRVLDEPHPMMASFPVGRIAAFQGVVTRREDIAAALQSRDDPLD